MSTLTAWHPLILLTLVAVVAVWVSALARTPIRALAAAAVVIVGFFALLPMGRGLWDTMSAQRTAVGAATCLGASVAQPGFWTGRVAPASLSSCQQRDEPPPPPAA